MAVTVLIFNILFFEGLTRFFDVSCVNNGLWYNVDENNLVGVSVVLIHAFFAMVPTSQFVKVFFTMPYRFGFFEIDFGELRRVQGFHEEGTVEANISEML